MAASPLARLRERETMAEHLFINYDNASELKERTEVSIETVNL